MTPADEASRYLRAKASEVEAELERLLPAGGEAPVLAEAMRYAVLGAGKRIRPALVLASAECVGVPAGTALPAACALELIHNYSLVHDDLPAMDNDDLRRGLPTVHRKFGEAEAILAGDALLTLAFAVVSDGSLAAGLPAPRIAALTGELARAAGVAGMCGGQSLELESAGAAADIDLIRKISRLKTGALFTAACRMGGIAAGAGDAEMKALTEFGEAFGLAFQIVDDLLDEAQDEAREGLPTFVSILGRNEAARLATTTTAEARQALAHFGESAVALLGILDLVSARQE